VFELELATGLVLVGAAQAQPIPIGSCFAFRKRDVLLTAAHCVPAGFEVHVWFNSPTRKRLERATVNRHPTADLAVLQIEAPKEEPFFAKHVLGPAKHEVRLGGDFLAFGYPVDGPSDLSEDGQRPTARLFKGHFQRYFSHTSHTGHNYWAGEMSVPAPTGLSGGPVVWRENPSAVCGVVTTNLETHAILDHVEEVQEDGRTIRMEARRVVHYGLALMLLGNLDPWLATHAPA
jgi:hypothetical protein